MLSEIPGRRSLPVLLIALFCGFVLALSCAPSVQAGQTQPEQTLSFVSGPFGPPDSTRVLSVFISARSRGMLHPCPT